MSKLTDEKLNIRDILQDSFPDDELLFMSEEQYDAAIVGVIEGKAHKPAVAYDFDKVIQILMEDGMTYEDAIEYWSFNQVDAYYGENTWVFLHKGI